MRFCRLFFLDNVCSVVCRKFGVRPLTAWMGLVAYVEKGKTSVSNLDVRILSVLTTGRSKDSGRPSGNIAFMKRSSAIKMAISRATVT